MPGDHRALMTSATETTSSPSSWLVVPGRLECQTCRTVWMTKHSWLLAVISAHLRYAGPHRRPVWVHTGLLHLLRGRGGRVFGPLFPEALLHDPRQSAVSRVHWTLRWAKPGAAEASDPGLCVGKLPAACTPTQLHKLHLQDVGWISSQRPRPAAYLLAHCTVSSSSPKS